MDVLTELATGILSTLAYGLVGIGLLALGYLALDLITPGNLGRIVYLERSWNAALVVASGIVAVGTIVTTAILVSEDAFARGLAGTIGYGVLGILLLVLSFVVIDWLTPGDLGTILTDHERHPAVYITAAAHLAVGATVAAAIA